MRAFFLFLASILISLAWLSPYHAFPWLTFSSEILSFAAVLSLLAGLCAQDLRIPKIQWMALPIVIIPLLQWMCGLVLDLSSALLFSFYLLGFWFAIVAGYNLALQTERVKLFTRICYVLTITSAISSVIAVLQWFNLDQHVYGVMELRAGNRPFANFAQPNNMSTFLLMGLMACLYLFEQRKLKTLLLISTSALVLFAIALSQSRTAWVVCLFFMSYWTYKTYKHPVRLRMPYMLVWVISFIGMIALLPSLSTLIASFGAEKVVEASSVAERATSGYLRFDIWTQMLLAIQQHPLSGYGWGQTSLAQLTIFNLHPSHEWVTSGHNILLDIIVWNGLPLGLLIIGYMTCWILWLNHKARSPESIIALLMVGAILIHALLEFPLRYAYFLFPFGFLLGFVQSQSSDLNASVLSKYVIRGIVVISGIFMLLIWRDYTVYKLNNGLAFRGKQPTQTVLGSTDIYLLTQFKDRLLWLQMNPTTQLSDDELTELGQMVKNRASPYNLHKYAQLLLANGKAHEAGQYLYYLNMLHHEQYTLQDLSAENAASAIYGDDEKKR
ncbi:MULTISPECIES: PglL family O-oligosaccharyltransferase [unclassified Acinetobacter]|uniref:PglL family O-oligosaccharyltransferase n=1 Tax=unclassified Acinetobacter TaxID=196816 RepID=UPI00190E3AB1|nr:MULTISPECIES: Wzy polymerase domain-containing protein [unclassified Acinetobacter]MBK0062857.1 O-antigen ligase C-terminal domain-containing protein [Acinetobacter sp. S55]MBK0065566.1 O-antigen ligase C-terminal domain-containing protein [Acinetobacter sp. S54]